MRVAVFSSKPYDQRFLEAAGVDRAADRLNIEWLFLEERLSAHTAVLAEGAEAVCVFVNDVCDAETIDALVRQDCQLIALRCAGFNNVDLRHAEARGIKVVRVPAYSPYAVAEHALTLMLCLNRRVHRAYNRVREGNFSLEGLLGFDMHGCTAGIVGVGKIGSILGNLLAAFGCRLLGHDAYQNEAFLQAGGKFVSLHEIFAECDIISLHCPLTPETHRMIDARAIDRMKRGVMLINTSRGGLIDTAALIAGLKSGQIGYVGLDVYEQEADLFFENLSETIIQDDVFQRLLTFPNVLITGHQAYFTSTALKNIADATVASLSQFARGEPLTNEVIYRQVAKA
jgi:D-lactate dehydrogenase